MGFTQIEYMTTKPDERLRYADTIDPVTTDGRDVDPMIATMRGEGAQQEASNDDRHLAAIAPSPWQQIPSANYAGTTYYDRPLLKKSVWGIDIPLYYFLGGAAGAALTLGAAIQLVSPRGRHPLRKLSAICHWTGIIGSTAGAGLLVHDLGRPSRFLYMMRVFRPTSPMNMGVWILSGAAPTAIATGLLVNRRGLAGRIGEVTGYLSGIFGAALAGYTGVLVSNSSIPVWQESRRWVPAMFMASSAATAASVIDVIAHDNCARTVTRVFGTAGRLAEIVAAAKVEHAASRIPTVAQPMRQGATALLWRAASGLTALGLAASLIPGRRRRWGIAAGVLSMAGSLCLRFAVHYIGNASAHDPRAAFQQQRQTATSVPESRSPITPS